MHIKILYPAVLGLSLIVSLSRCKRTEDDNNLQPTLTDRELVQQHLYLDLDQLPNYAAPAYPVHYDANIRGTDNAPSINPVTDAGAALGRVIFYDKQISRNGAVACASCHDQAKGFSDDKILSEGFLGGHTGKHSMRLGNTNFYTGDRMFWDKRAADLEAQTIMPIQDATEMGFDASVGGIDSLLHRMAQIDYYPVLFNRAFGSPKISTEKVQRALAQFIRSMVSINSKFDSGLAQVFAPGQPGGGAIAPFPNFTQQENAGKALFLNPPNMGGAGCAGCHQPPTFALVANSQNNGLDAGETTIFKSPSLKNVGAAGHYMHDGRFATLEEVVEHYNSGIQNSPTLDNRLRTPNGQPIRLNLNAAQKASLVAFLNTLTDNTLMSDDKFGNPFKE